MYSIGYACMSIKGDNDCWEVVLAGFELELLKTIFIYHNF
jgi:hypothetical protein